VKRQKPKNLKQLDQSNFCPSDVIPPLGYVNKIDSDGILRRRKVRSDLHRPRPKHPVPQESINLTFLEIHNYQNSKENDIIQIMQAFRDCFYQMFIRKPNPMIEVQFYQFLQNNIAYFPVYSIIENFCKLFDYAAIPGPVSVPRLLLP
jgi:hypothetical protein